MAPPRRPDQPGRPHHPGPQGPGVDLLDAVRRGEWEAALGSLPPGARMSIPQFKLVLHGSKLRVFIDDALFFFPDLTYRPRLRSVGPGLVIDEGYIHGTPPSTISGSKPMTAPIMVAVHHTDAEVRSLVVDLDPAPIHGSLGRQVNRSAVIHSEVATLRHQRRDELEDHELSPVVPGVPDGPRPEGRSGPPPEEQRRRGPIIRRR